MNDESIESGTSSGAEPIKTIKAKPIKTLPTDRLGFERQLSVLRGYAAVSGPERKAVSNKEVGTLVQIHENTVSICNPFLQDLGLLVKEGQKNRPSDEVTDYAQAFEWDSEKAAHKLAIVFRTSWFGTALIPKLTFRKTLTKDEATTFLANEAKAPKDYKVNLEIILEYLKAAGVIQSDGATITLGPNAKDTNDGALLNGKPDGGDEDPAQLGGKFVPKTLEDTPPKMEPLIRGLIDKLPLPDTNWGLIDRAKWLNAAANIFDLMYGDSGDEGISVTLEGKTLSIKKGPL